MWCSVHGAVECAVDGCPACPTRAAAENARLRAERDEVYVALALAEAETALWHEKFRALTAACSLEQQAVAQWIDRPSASLRARSASQPC